MQITFLGTASCYPTKHRGVCCTALRFEDGDVWLFDCGEGSQIQIQKSGVKVGRITRIFITHLHGDHLFGLPGLMCTLGNQVTERKDFTLEIFGPQGLRKYLRHALSLSRSPLPYLYVVHELIPVEEQFPEDWNSWKVNHLCEEPCHPQEKLGQEIAVESGLVWNVIEDKTAVVQAGVILHRVPTFGYVIKEKDQPGKLDIELLLQLGTTPGPLYSKLKKGETVTFPNGVTVEPSQVLGPNKPGRKVTVLGDTFDPSRIAELARNSDVLIHEATVEDALMEKAIETGHSTPSMAAKFALSIGVKLLVLNHVSQRYKSLESDDDDEACSVMKLLDEARQALGDSDTCRVMLAEDYTVLDVPRPS
ncbi:zinc phosphodiesterase ELAC protein 1 [Anabrus simplex]|uniref:zinc phosphodiesterase ELAC protein 1 n=1 Tax=Anabrus simplex TaxID=316456 RepID=UPI0034DD3B4B